MTSIMGLADDLLETFLMGLTQWEESAEKMDDMAKDLESIKKKCNAGDCAGNSLSIAGSVCLFLASVYTLVFGKAASDVMELSGKVCATVGMVVTQGTAAIENVLSSDRMKALERIEKEIEKTEQGIQQLRQRLEDEIQSKNPSGNQDMQERDFMACMVEAVATRNGMGDNFRFSNLMHSLSQKMKPEAVGGVKAKLDMARTLAAIAELPNVFGFMGSEKKCSSSSSPGFCTKLTRGIKVVSNGVTVAIDLCNAINSWKKMIKGDHTTEASQSLRDTAKYIRNTTQTVRHQLDKTKILLEEMVRQQ